MAAVYVLGALVVWLVWRGPPAQGVAMKNEAPAQDKRELMPVSSSALEPGAVQDTRDFRETNRRRWNMGLNILIRPTRRA